MRSIKLLLVLLLLPAAIYAQEILSAPPAKFLARFPFRQYSGGVMVVRATFENIKDSLNFILDTGSGGISLDSSTCAEFNVITTPTDTTITGIGGIRKVNFVFNKKLNFPGLTVDGLNFHVNDYDLLSSVYGEKIDGIIGYSFFRRYIIKIDFDSLMIEVFTPGKISYPKSGTVLHPIFTSLPIEYIQFKDRKKINYNFYFDTGAGLCFLLNEKFADDSAVFLKKRDPVYTQAEGIAGKSQMKLTVVKELKFGLYRFRNVPTYIYKDEYNVTSYPFAGGLIGNDLLRRFNLIINYRQREIHILPNSHFNDNFDYAYTGLSIYYEAGKILILDIIKNSPADRDGFKVGDQIIAVNENFSNNIQVYKDILQTSNIRVKIIVKRNGELMLINLKTASIL